MLCAYGDATTQVQDEASRTYVDAWPTRSLRRDEFNLLADLEALRAAGRRVARSRTGSPSADQEVIYQADLRYAGQAFQLSLNVTADELQSKGLAVLTDEFDRQHEQLFTFAHGKDHEIVMIRAIVKAKSSLTAELKEVHEGETDLASATIHDTKFYYEQEWHEAPILRPRQARRRRCRDGARDCSGDGLDNARVARSLRHRRQSRQPAHQPGLIEESFNVCKNHRNELHAVQQSRYRSSHGRHHRERAQKRRESKWTPSCSARP